MIGDAQPPLNFGRRCKPLEKRHLDTAIAWLPASPVLEYASGGGDGLREDLFGQTVRPIEFALQAAGPV